MNNHTHRDIDELESEEDVGELANQCRILRTRIAELEAERDRLRCGLHPHHTGALERVITRLDDEAEMAAQKGDYDAMLPEGDARSLRDVRDLLVRTDTEDK